LTIDLDLLGKTTRKLADKAKEKGDLLSWSDNGDIMMTMEFTLGIFKSILIDFLIIFEIELNIDSRITNVFDPHIFFINIIDRYIKV